MSKGASHGHATLHQRDRVLLHLIINWSSTVSCERFTKQVETISLNEDRRLLHRVGIIRSELWFFFSNNMMMYVVISSIIFRKMGNNEKQEGKHSPCQYQHDPHQEWTFESLTWPSISSAPPLVFFSIFFLFNYVWGLMAFKNIGHHNSSDFELCWVY